MARIKITFCLELEVNDTQQLYEAALKHAVEVDGLSADEAKDFICDSSGNPSIKDCVTALLDPGHVRGCEILASSAQEH